MHPYLPYQPLPTLAYRHEFDDTAEFRTLDKKDFVIKGTLGMGGFGRVELVRMYNAMQYVDTSSMCGHKFCTLSCCLWSTYVADSEHV